MVAETTHISPAIFASVGTGGLPDTLDALPTSVAPLRDDTGRPIIFYAGAEYCPYCAASRWSLIAALSRFGTFASLPLLVSSEAEGDLSNIQTFTFHGSAYSSAYLDFQPVELEDRYERPLDTMTDAQSQLFNTLDYPPYTDASTEGGIPFVDFANVYLAHSSGYAAQTLVGLTRESIVTDLQNPTNAVTQAIIGSANYLTAAICRVTGDTPSSVCGQAPIPAIEATLPART